MLPRTIKRIDKFLIILSLVLTALALVVIFTIRAIFDSLNLAGQLGDGGVEARVDKPKLESVFKSVVEK